MVPCCDGGLDDDAEGGGLMKGLGGANGFGGRDEDAEEEAGTDGLEGPNGFPGLPLVS